MFVGLNNMNIVLEAEKRVAPNREGWGQKTYYCSSVGMLRRLDAKGNTSPEDFLGCRFYHLSDKNFGERIVWRGGRDGAGLGKRSSRRFRFLDQYPEHRRGVLTRPWIG